jgi:O-antigen/teichoic acid export membrane protein
LIAGWVLVSDGRMMVLASALLASLAMALQALANIVVSYFHGIRQMGLGVRGSFAGRLVLVLATALFLWLGGGVVSVFAAQILDSGITLLLVGQVYRGLIPRWHWPTFTEVRSFLSECLPFNLNGFFGSIYLSADVLLLGLFKEDREVGVYRGAVMLISLFPIIAETFTAGLYPRMAQALNNPAQVQAELGFASRILLVISLPAAIGGILTAEPLLVFLGGPEFSASALPFMVMAPLLPLRFLNNGFSMTLSALNRQEARTRGVFYAALLNIGLNLLILPFYGALGAACTTLATEIFLSLYLNLQIFTLVQKLDLKNTLLKTGIPALAMAAVLLLLPMPHVLLTISLGALSYGAAGYLTHAWRPGDLSRLRKV